MKAEQEIQSLVQDNKELHRKLLEQKFKNKELIEEITKRDKIIFQLKEAMDIFTQNQQ